MRAGVREIETDIHLTPHYSFMGKIGGKKDITEREWKASASTTNKLEKKKKNLCEMI